MNFLVEAIRYFELVAEKIIRSNADTKETKSRKKEVVRDGEKQKKIRLEISNYNDVKWTV